MWSLIYVDVVFVEKQPTQPSGESVALYMLLISLLSSI